MQGVFAGRPGNGESSVPLKKGKGAVGPGKSVRSCCCLADGSLGLCNCACAAELMEEEVEEGEEEEEGGMMFA